MGRTVTLNEIENQSVSELMQEASQRQRPLIVMLKNGKAVFIQQYQTTAEVIEDLPKLEPLPQFSVDIPQNWKDIIYGCDGTGSADKSNDW